MGKAFYVHGQNTFPQRRSEKQNHFLPISGRGGSLFWTFSPELARGITGQAAGQAALTIHDRFTLRTRGEFTSSLCRGCVEFSEMEPGGPGGEIR